MYPWGDARPYHSYAAYCRRTVRPAGYRNFPVDARLHLPQPRRHGRTRRVLRSANERRPSRPPTAYPRRTVRQQVDDAIAFHRQRVSGRNSDSWSTSSRTAIPMRRSNGSRRLLRGGTRACPASRGSSWAPVPTAWMRAQAGLSAPGWPAAPVRLPSNTASNRPPTPRCGHDRPGPRLRARHDAPSRRRPRRGVARGRALHPRPARRERHGAARPHAHRINALPLATVKFHQLQVRRGRRAMADRLRRGARAVPPLDGRRIRRPDGRNPAPPAARHRRRTHRGSDTAPHPLPAAVGQPARRCAVADARKKTRRKNAHQGEFFVSSQR